MARNLVLLSDGTGNHGRAGHETNVWRLYQALDRNPVPPGGGIPDQLAFYDQGVGTEDWKPLRLLGGAVGWGLSGRVCSLYTRLAVNYRDGDRIFLFGFSRGAYTVRLVSGLIGIFGVLDLSAIPEPCGRMKLAKEALDRARSAREDPEDVRRDIESRLRERFGSEVPSRDADIEVLGVFDTVDAVGVPFDGLRRLIDRISDYRMPDQRPHPRVKAGYHALALDDERTTFHPVLWDESDLPKDRIIEQVWFAGVHANVGGGYPTAGLSSIALDWMMDRAERHGLGFIPSRRSAARSEMDAGGRLYDSRSGLKSYYRYAPRRVEEVCAKHHARVRIHESVLQRIEETGCDYAPVWVPGKARIASTELTGRRSSERDSRWLAGVQADPHLKRARGLSLRPRRFTYEWLLFGTILALLSRVWGPLAGLDPEGEPIALVAFLPPLLRWPLAPLLTNEIVFGVAASLLAVGLAFKLILFRAQRASASRGWELSRRAARD